MDIINIQTDSETIINSAKDLRLLRMSCSQGEMVIQGIKDSF
jgi:hypothetical protein